MKRLLAVALVLSACGSGYVYPTAAPAVERPDLVEDAMVLIAPAREPVTGVITFGTSFDPDTLDIPEPLTRFKRTFPVIAWSADLAHGVNAAFVSWTVVRRTDSGIEETMFDVEEPIDGSTITSLANSADLAFHVDHIAGTYVMRYLDSSEILAEGTFTLVK